MKKHLLLIILSLAFISLNGQNLNLGVKFQKTHSLYWENGISAQYSFKTFKPDQFYIGFDYVTSRLGSAFSSNAIKQDNIVASIAWHFRKNKPFRIITELNFGITKADLEEEIFSDLPSSAKILAPEVGVAYNFKNYPVVANLGFGFNINVGNGGESPGTQQPLFYHLALYYQFPQNQKIDEE